MTTLSTVRTALRSDLRDTDATNYRWTDAELAVHIARAVAEYSRAAPRDMKTTKATTASSRAVDISALSGVENLVKIHAVEYPVDKTPRRFQRFDYYNFIITLVGDDVPDGTNSYIYWGSIHTLADSGTPTSSIPEKDLYTVRTGAAGYAALAWATYAANRINVGGGPTPQEFLRWGNERLVQFGKELRKLGSRVRAMRLYAPERPGASKATDWGA